MGQSVENGLFLLGGVGHSLLPLLPSDEAVHVSAVHRGTQLVQEKHFIRDVLFLLIGGAVVDIFPPLKAAADQASRLQLSLHGSLYPLAVGTEQTDGGLGQLLPREANVTVLPGVGGEQVLDAAHNAILTLGIQPQGHGHLIRPLKADALHLIAEAVGVLAGDIHRPGAPLLVDAHRHGRAEIVAEEHHGRADARLGLEILRDLLGLLAGDALHVGEPLGVVLHHVQGFVPKAGHDALGQLGSHSLDGAGGQVAQDGRRIRRHIPLILLHLELAAVLGIMRPLAPQNQGVALVDVGHDAAGGDNVVLQSHVHNRVTVILVAVDDVLHGSLELGQPVSASLGFLPARKLRGLGRQEKQIVIHPLRPPFMVAGSVQGFHPRAPA